MPKISKEVWESRRQQILVAAGRCFYQYGIQATTMEQIILESGMSTSAMYRYFEGKGDIVFATIAKNLHDFAEISLPAVALAGDKDPVVFFKEMLMALEEFAERDGYNLKTLIVQAWGEYFSNPKLAELMRAMYGGYFEALSGLAAEWGRRGIVSAQVKPADLAAFLMASFMGSIAQSSIVGTKSASIVAGIDGLRHFK